MAQPWQVLESVPTREGVLELRQRGEKDFLITLGGLVLMNSISHRSELALGALACRNLRRKAGARVLVGGLGMGFTLRAVLDSLPATGRVLVAEINPVMAQWCRGPLGPLTGRAAEDPRVTLEYADVTSVIRKSAMENERFHAIVLDLYEGPGGSRDGLYGNTATEWARAALEPGGVYAVWGEQHDPVFEKTLKAADFSVARERPGHGGLRHVVYLATAQLTRGPGRKPAPKAG